MIVMTKAQANQVRCLTTKGHALSPQIIKVSAAASIAGKLCLPEACINDPEHARFKTLLQSFTTVADNLIPVTSWETDPAIVGLYNFTSGWPLGQVVVVP